MDSFFPFLGGWFWFIVAALLLIGELLLPGVFLLWLGAAAALTGVIDYLFNLGWQAEIAVFAIASLALVLLSWKTGLGRWSKAADQPHLNHRHSSYVGKVVPLEQAIVNGSGKVKIEDALWDVDGPDLEKGARVKITGVKGLRLLAEAA